MTRPTFVILSEAKDLRCIPVAEPGGTCRRDIVWP